MKVSDLTPGEYAEFYFTYVNQVPDITLRAAFDDSAAMLTDYLTNLAEGREDYAYAPGKWTIKEALQHIIDTERIFANRALRLGRHDASPMPGFDQDAYAGHADVSRREFTRMIEEFRNLRQTTISLFAGFGEEDLRFVGTASGQPISCRAMGFLLCGHVYHHCKVYREKYGE